MGIFEQMIIGTIRDVCCTCRLNPLEPNNRSFIWFHIMLINIPMEMAILLFRRGKTPIIFIVFMQTENLLKKHIYILKKKKKSEKLNILWVVGHPLLGWSHRPSRKGS
jgi:hypothetical protein